MTDCSILNSYIGLSRMRVDILRKRKGDSMQYICTICGYMYDDAVEPVPFSELPEDWTCPLCGASKDLFEPVAGKEEVKEEKMEELETVEELEEVYS